MTDICHAAYVLQIKALDAQMQTEALAVAFRRAMGSEEPAVDVNAARASFDAWLSSPPDYDQKMSDEDRDLRQALGLL